MAKTAFFRSLHFRLTGLFLLLLAVFAVSYYLWVDKVIFSPDWVEGEQEWRQDRQEAEFDSLALELAPVAVDNDAVQAVLDEFAKQVEDFDVELSFIDVSGKISATTSVQRDFRMLEEVSPSLLDSMSLPEWDFQSFPIAHDLDAFANMIFAVTPVRSDPDSTAVPDGWLIGALGPFAVPEEEFEHDQRLMIIWGTAAILVYAALSGLILMAWVSRRIRKLSRGMDAFRGGDFSTRIESGAADEIGSLGRDFNSMADRLSALIDKLEQSSDFQRRLVANVSHDLRTPMAALRGYVETLSLSDGEMSDADRDRCMDRIIANVESLEDLIERLFELSRLDSGQQEFHHETFPLEELVVATLERCEGLAEKKGVRLTHTAADDLPLVWADPVRIGQVLQNLVANGIKFNNDGGEVTVAISASGGNVTINVRDTGVGIADDDLTHVFERFFTGDRSRTGRGKGTGLGLAIAHSIVAGHGRELTVTSSDGNGADFIFSLPAAPENNCCEPTAE